MNPRFPRRRSYLRGPLRSWPKVDAKRGKASDYPQRWAQNAPGHNSTAVHQAYAREGLGVCPSLEDYEQALKQKIVAVPVQKVKPEEAAKAPVNQ